MRMPCSALVLVPALTGSGNTDPGGGFDDGFDCQPVIVISTNHGHALVEPQTEEELLEPFVVGGRTGHTHQLAVTERDLEAFFNGQSVTVETTSDSLHTHRVSAGGCPDLFFDHGFDGGFDGGLPPAPTLDDG